MKGKTPKTFAMLLLASALAITAGCSGSGGGNTASDTPKDTGDTTSPITFTFFGADASPNWNNMKDAVGQEITKQTGVTIEAEYDVNNGGDQKIPLMAASGEYPDIIYPKGNLSKLVDADAMLDLTDLIDKYAPNLKKIYGDQMNRLKYSLEDQSIYTIPTNMGVDNVAFDATGGFEIQQKVLKELGYPEVKTLEDYEKVLKEYYAKHPTIDGQPTIPLTLNADDWKIMITVTNPAFQATGGPDDGEYYINPETYEAVLHYKRPEEKEYFRWLNKMYNEGILDKDTFVQKDDQYKSKIASGRVLGLIDQEWNYGEAENALKSVNNGENTYAHFSVSLNKDIVDHTFQPTGFDGYGIGISKTAKDPVRIIKFMDWLASDEGQVLRNWGIEGQHYNVENGKRVIPADVQDRKVNDNSAFTKETGIGMYNIFSARYGDGVKDSTGNYYTTNFPEQIQAGYTAAEKETLKAYGITTWKDFYPSEDDLKLKDWGAAYNMPVPSDTDYNVTFQKTQDIIRKRIPEAVLAKPEKFDQVYDGLLAELDKAGAVEMEKQYTVWIKERVSLWTGKDVK
ncbi:ABC transporter substrate-binding protein [Paenibacillus sp. FSL W7-1088]|uniref:ABC transporter substrate-binding protein n=1 Tax=unclassified Paenibacillus TaxID=185978 RepID=UPI0015C6601D|nr:ABC transporter substrate-binding protein [Paenibacillus sp. E222]QLG38432.1 extracellular solute-binding protein [Paenibacillus sp. E222]